MLVIDVNNGDLQVDVRELAVQAFVVRRWISRERGGAETASTLGCAIPPTETLRLDAEPSSTPEPVPGQESSLW